MNRELRFRAWDLESKQWLDKDELFISVLDGSLSGWQKDCKWKLMQYTGLKDTNGKEIYEGDIVTPCGFFQGNYPLQKGVVEWEPQNNKYSYISWSNGVTVIGNIYENPELLTEQHATTL